MRVPIRVGLLGFVTVVALATVRPLPAATSLGTLGDGIASLQYNSGSGVCSLDVPSGLQLRGLNLQAVASDFIAGAANWLTPPANPTLTTNTPAQQGFITFSGAPYNDTFLPANGYVIGAILPAGLAQSYLLTNLTITYQVEGQGGTKTGDLLYVSPATHQWALATGGPWGTAGNWTPSGVPNGAGTVATLGTNLTAAGTIDLAAADRTVGTLAFNNAAASYTLGATAGGKLLLQADAGNATVRFDAANTRNHTISAGVRLLSNVDFTLGSNTLTLSGTVDYNGKSISVSGGTLAAGGAIANANSVQVKSGSLTAPSLAAAALVVGSPTPAATPVPEPSSLALLAALAAGAGVWARRRT